MKGWNVTTLKFHVLSILGAVLSLGPATALAHPGHGSAAPDSLAHYFLDPVHASVFAVVASLAIVTTIGWRRRRRENA